MWHCKRRYSIIDNDWGDTKFPVIPGHEIIGLVDDVNSNVTTLKRGDRVGIGYQQEACFNCDFCNQGHEQFCPRQKVIGVHTNGGLAEFIVTDNRFVFKLPAKLASAKSVPLLSSGLTVYTGITRARLQDSANVAVLGVGGLGQLAIQFLKKMGHKVSAFSHSPQKREMVSELGAEYFDTSNESSLVVLDRQFDFMLSTLNVQFDINKYLRMLKPQGKICLVAQPPENLSINTGLLYEYAQRTIYGNYTGSRKDMREMLAFAEKFGIKSIVETLPFSKVNEVIEMVRTGAPMRLILENVNVESESQN
ncbi:MAG TPA: NAD(P)-dependent alcohol dehydrogenase [Ohtaekwangia sp.]|nr:NAD(P)-dependent alcohol dehydrogenase [Ohtaekwangia sp.]